MEALSWISQDDFSAYQVAALKLNPPSIARRLQHYVVMDGWGAEGAGAASRVWFPLVQIHISPEMQNMDSPSASVPECSQALKTVHRWLNRAVLLLHYTEIQTRRDAQTSCTLCCRFQEHGKGRAEYTQTSYGPELKQLRTEWPQHPCCWLQTSLPVPPCAHHPCMVRDKTLPL